MKISLTRNQREHRVETANPPAGAVSWGAPFAAGTSRSRGFTMMEIAISLAIIGIALVAIIGVLPIGMNAQQDNRQETIIGQDASVLVEDIRNGALGANELTNYVYAITNYWVQYNANGSLGLTGVNGYTYAAASVPNTYPLLGEPLTNGANIVGLLSTPEFIIANGPNAGNPTANIYTQNYFSNHVVAYV
jgi:prepilin-type N-terminal cleavage/methylation domain-containing protein